MNAKHNFCFYVAVILSLLSRLPPAKAVTAGELADISEAMESAIVGISLEYEWYNIPPRTFEEIEEFAGPEMRMQISLPKDGVRRFKLSAAGLLFNRDPNDPNWKLPDRLLFEESTTIVDADGNSWDKVTKASYNGKIAKYLQVGGWPQEVRSGGISYTKRYYTLPMTLTPIGFSVLRFKMSNVTKKTALSAMLRRKEFVRLDNTVAKVNGFNTVRADFLQEWSKQVCIRVYFSVDHGYTPVRYEYIRPGRPESGKSEIVAGTVEVHSLEEVTEGLWFPSSGLISSSGKTRVDAFQTIGKILVNQGLTDEHFDIEFPPGTEVRDEVRDLEYVVKPTEEQFEQ